MSKHDNDHEALPAHVLACIDSGTMPTRASVRAALRVPDMNQCRSCYDICDDKDFDFATGRCRPCQADRNARDYDADRYTKANYLADRRKDDEADKRERETI